MTTVEEDLLLNGHVASDYDSLAVLDEDLLLDAGDISRRATSADDMDAALLLDSVEHAPEQDPERVSKLSKTNDNGEEIESEKEELDYDEEEDDDEGRRERTSRYTSERKGRASRQDSEECDNSKKENSDGKAKRPGIPSLFDKTITNNPMKSGDQPIGVVLRIEGEPERIFYPPPAFMMQLHQQPIVPRLPNGIPLVGMPTNHGRAGFGAGYQQQQPQHPGRLAGGGGTAGQWDNEVEKFLSNTKSRSGAAKKRRSASYSSASSYSSGSRSRSRSSSRSERRRRDEKRRRKDRYDRKDERESRRDDRRSGESRRGEEKRRHDDRRSRDRDSHSDRRRKEQSKNSALESVKALGLSTDYITQVNDQKRRRDEHMKNKEMRRHAPTVTSTAESKERKETVPAPTPSVSSNKESSNKAIKAYLAVNVCGVQQLPTAVKKIEALANELGPIKKCWRSSDDVVSIIFNAHDKAKDFMIKYNHKVLSGLRITVSLEKKFLNLSEIN